MTLPATLGAPTTFAREGASLAVSGLLALLLAMAVQSRDEPLPPEPDEPLSISEPVEPTPPQPATVVLPEPPAVPEAPAAEVASVESLPSQVDDVPDAQPASEPETTAEPEPDAVVEAEAIEPVALEQHEEPKAQQTLGRQHVERGRPLLLLLESGQGPAISIDWPRQASAREALATRLSACYGVELALLSADGALYRLNDLQSSAHSFDLDRWSGFLRMPSGQLSALERQMAAELRSRYSVPGAQVVRLFPRAVDAALLGGLSVVLGERYQSASAIRLAYELTQNGRAPVTVQLVAVDGQPGELRLSLPAQQRCTLS